MPTAGDKAPCRGKKHNAVSFYRIVFAKLACKRPILFWHPHSLIFTKKRKKKKKKGGIGGLPQ